MESTPQPKEKKKIKKTRPDSYSYFVCTAASREKHLLKPGRGLHTHRERETSVFYKQICLEGHVKLSYKVTLGTRTQHKQLEWLNTLNQSHLSVFPASSDSNPVWRAGG